MADNDRASVTSRDITREELAQICREAMRAQGGNFDLMMPEMQGRAMAYIAEILKTCIRHGFVITAPKEVIAAPKVIVLG